MKPYASIIILNLNGKRFLKDCLDSLKNQSFKNFEIIMIDNGSTDNSMSFVKESFPEIKIIENPENLGFAKANNQGIEISKGEYIITLNNDTKTDKQWLKNLISAAQMDEKIGMCASKILSMNNQEEIDSVGVNICWDGMARGKGRLEIDKRQYNGGRDILLPSACAALYKKKMLEEVGLFDESFFAYCEDADLGLRGRLAGWQAVFVPNSIIYHFYSGTGGKYSSLKAYLVERNHIWLVVKNFPITLILLFPMLTIYRLLLQAMAAFMNRGASSEFLSESSLFEAVKIIFRAYRDAIKELPKFVKKRKDIQKNKKLLAPEFYSLLKKHRLTFRELVFKK